MQHQRPLANDYFCSHCSRTFVNPYTFNRHVESRICYRVGIGGGSRGKKHRKKGKNKGNYDIENNGEHNKSRGAKSKKFECDECRTKFARRSILLRHKQRYHMNIPISFPCGFCSKLFPNGEELDRHRKKEHPRKRRNNDFYLRKHALKNVCQVCHTLTPVFILLHI